MSDPRPLYDASDRQENPEGYKAYKSKKSIAKRMNDGKAPMGVKTLAKNFAKHADTYDRVNKSIKKDIAKRGGKLPF